jgi:hypothetical protein
MVPVGGRVKDHAVPIWFFIGALLTLYGFLILGAGLYEVAFPARSAVVFRNDYVDLWWGSGMILLGSIYLIRFWPKRG